MSQTTKQETKQERIARRRAERLKEEHLLSKLEYDIDAKHHLISKLEKLSDNTFSMESSISPSTIIHPTYIHEDKVCEQILNKSIRIGKKEFLRIIVREAIETGDPRNLSIKVISADCNCGLVIPDNYEYEKLPHVLRQNLLTTITEEMIDSHEEAIKRITNYLYDNLFDELLQQEMDNRYPRQGGYAAVNWVILQWKKQLFRLVVPDAEIDLICHIKCNDKELPYHVPPLDADTDGISCFRDRLPKIVRASVKRYKLYSPYFSWFRRYRPYSTEEKQFWDY